MQKTARALGLSFIVIGGLLITILGFNFFSQHKAAKSQAVTSKVYAFESGLPSSLGNLGLGQVSIGNPTTMSVTKHLLIDASYNIAGSLATPSNDKTKIYVPATKQDTADSKVFILNTATDTIYTSIDLGTDVPIRALLNSSGTKLFVATFSGSTSAAGYAKLHKVIVIDTLSNAIASTIVVGTDDSHGISSLGLSPDGSRLYVQSAGIQIYNTTDNSFMTSNPSLGFNAIQNLNITPDGTLLYAESDNLLHIVNATTLDSASEKTVPIGGGGCSDISTNATVVGLSSDCRTGVFSSDGKTFYTLGFGLEIIDTTTLSRLSIPSAGGAGTFAFSGDHKWLYLPNPGSSAITVFNVSTQQVVKYIGVGTNPTGIVTIP